MRRWFVNFEAGFGITFLNHRQMIGVGFSKAELRLSILLEVPPELEILMRLPIKSIELGIVFTEASKNSKSIFLNNEDAIKTFKKIIHLVTLSL
jgi:hypothetical protein